MATEPETVSSQPTTITAIQVESVTPDPGSVPSRLSAARTATAATLRRLGLCQASATALQGQAHHDVGMHQRGRTGDSAIPCLQSGLSTVACR